MRTVAGISVPVLLPVLSSDGGAALLGSHLRVTPPLPSGRVCPGATAQRRQENGSKRGRRGEFPPLERPFLPGVPGEEGTGSKLQHQALPKAPKWRLARRRRRLVATRPAGPASRRELQLPACPLGGDYNSRHALRGGGGRPALHIPAGGGGSGQSARPIVRGARPAASGGSGAVTFPAGPPPEPLPERGPGWQRWEVGAGRPGSARGDREGPGEGCRGLCVEGCVRGFGPVLGELRVRGSGVPGWAAVPGGGRGWREGRGLRAGPAVRGEGGKEGRLSREGSPGCVRGEQPAQGTGVDEKASVKVGVLSLLFAPLCCPNFVRSTLLQSAALPDLQLLPPNVFLFELSFVVVVA